MPDNTGELVPADLATYSGGRLDANATGTADDLAAAVAAARRFCRWHVTGIRSEVVTLDGPGSLMLALPTLKLRDLTLVSELGVVLDVTTLDWSADGKVRKLTNQLWTKRYRGIVVTMTHGFDTPDAADFHRAILSCADRLSLATGGGRRTVVGPFQYAEERESATSPFSLREQAMLQEYRLGGRP